MSNIKFAGKTPMCVNSKCRHFYSLKKMDEVQTELAHETGLCPKCQADASILVQFKVVKEAETNEMIELINTAEDIELVDILNTSDDNITELVHKAKSSKPSRTIRNTFIDIVKTGCINDQMTMCLTDKTYALKTFCGMKYAFIKEIDTNGNIHDQIKINGKARYSTKLIEINGKSFSMTNDIYHKNLASFIKWAEQFGLDKVC